MKKKKFFTDRYYTHTSTQNPLKNKVRKWLATWKTPHCFAKALNQLASNSLVVDIGCGRGELVQNIAAWRPDLKIIGVDWTEAHPVSGIEFIRGDAMSLPFEDEVADMVICKHLIEHLPTPEKLFSEFRRILRPTGLLYLECPDVRGCYPFIFPKFYDDPTHIRPYTIQALSRLNDLNGFVTLKKGRKRNLLVLIGGLFYSPFAWWFGDRAFKDGFFIELWGLYIFLLAKKVTTR